MCGGGGESTASRAARLQEGKRRRQVTSATSAIDRAFAGRGSQLDDFVQSLRENFRTEATQQKSDADRRLKFGLARGGLTGGSAAADAGKRSGREFQEGLLQGERRVQGSLADLTAADAASRRQLIALAQGGASVGTSAIQAANALRSNIKGARSAGLASDIGDIFSDTRALFVSQEEAAARRKGLKESELFAEPFSRGT